MTLTTILTENAPKAIGPYSQAIRTGNLVFCSGQIPIVPATGNVVEGDIVEHTVRSLVVGDRRDQGNVDRNNRSTTCLRFSRLQDRD